MQPQKLAMGQCYRFVGWEFLGFGLEQFPLERREGGRVVERCYLEVLEAKTWWSMTLLVRPPRTFFSSNLRLFWGAASIFGGHYYLQILRYNYFVSLLPLADQNLLIHMTYCSHNATFWALYGTKEWVLEWFYFLTNLKWPTWKKNEGIVAAKKWPIMKAVVMEKSYWTCHIILAHTIKPHCMESKR